MWLFVLLGGTNVLHGNSLELNLSVFNSFYSLLIVFIVHSHGNVMGTKLYSQVLVYPVHVRAIKLHFVYNAFSPLLSSH